MVCGKGKKSLVYVPLSSENASFLRSRDRSILRVALAGVEVCDCIGARPAAEIVGPQPAGQQIVAGAAGQRVILGPAIDCEADYAGRERLRADQIGAALGEH